MLRPTPRKTRQERQWQQWLDDLRD